MPALPGHIGHGNRKILRTKCRRHRAGAGISLTLIIRQFFIPFLLISFSLSYVKTADSVRLKKGRGENALLSGREEVRFTAALLTSSIFCAHAQTDDPDNIHNFLCIWNRTGIPDPLRPSRSARRRRIGADRSSQPPPAPFSHTSAGAGSLSLRTCSAVWQKRK